MQTKFNLHDIFKFEIKKISKLDKSANENV